MGLIGLIRDFIGCTSILNGYRNQLVVCESKFLNAKASLVTSQSKVVKLKQQIEILSDQYDKLEASKKDELDFLTEKDDKIDVLYQIVEKDKKYTVDIHNFLCEYDSTIPLVSGVNNDLKALKSLIWVIDNIKYVSDSIQYADKEFWAKAYQTLVNKKGDCEDGAILLWNILLKAGVPWQRVRLCCGNIAGGGHAYVTYCRETDNEWVVLDWCYWANKRPVDDRPTHKEERNYMNKEKNYYVWFSVDKKNGYARQKSTSVKMFKGKLKVKR